MGNDEDRAAALFVQLAECFRQSGERPQIDACLRLVKDHKPGIFGQQGRNLDALDLAAGQACVHVAVQIVARAQTYLRQIGTGLVMGKRLARRDGEKVGDLHALEPGRLLKGIRNAALCAVGDGKAGDVLAVQKNLAAGGGRKAHDELGQRRLAAAVRAGNDKEFSVFYVQRDVFDNVRASLRVSRCQAEILECQHSCSSLFF